MFSASNSVLTYPVMSIKIIMYHLCYDGSGRSHITDADWAENIDDRKSTSGDAFFLGKRLVSWTSKKKNCTSQSTTEVEYVAATVNCSNIVWFKQLLEV